MRITGLLAVLFVFGLQAQYTAVETFAGAGPAGSVDGSLATAQFNGPYGVCYDADHDAIYTADLWNNCIRKIHGGVVTTIVGGLAGDSDGNGTAARLNGPSGVYYKNGYLYICDNLNSKIKRMDGNGNVVTIAGSGVEGFQDGPALQARFYQPKSLVVNDAGVVFVADYENHRIRKIENGTVTTYAGSGIAGDGTGPALSANLHRPRDLCLGSDGTLYFVDLMNHRVKKVTADGATVALVAGSGSAGSVDGTGANASFNTPVGIDWLNSNELVVLDAVNPKVRRVGINGVVTTIAGSGTAGFQDGALMSSRFELPQDVCLDAFGNIYIGDRDNNRIRRIIAAPPPCLAQAGGLQAGPFEPCLSNNGTLLTAIPGGDAVVPAGFAVLYLLSSGNDQVIAQVGNDPSFTVTQAGEWSIHTLVYDPAAFDPGVIDLDVTTIAVLEGNFPQGGGSACGSLDTQGATFTTLACGGPCLAASGGMQADNVLVCLIDGQAHLTASPTGSQVVPPGFALIYLLSRTNGLIIEQIGNVPAFTVTSEDVWRIHAFVYQPSTFDPASIVLGSTLIYDIQPQLVEWGGDICASLDISGGAMKSAPCGWTCTMRDTVLTLCYQGGPVELLDLLPNTCVGGSWTDPAGQAWSGAFDPASSATGEYTYSVVDPNGTVVKMSVTVELVECPNEAPVIDKGGNDAGQTTGVNTGSNVQPGVLAWPIPVSDKLFLAAPTGALDISGIEVFDASGKPMTIAIQRTTDRIVLDTEHLPAGVYFVRVRSNGHAEVVRFLKHAPR